MAKPKFPLYIKIAADMLAVSDPTDLSAELCGRLDIVEQFCTAKRGHLKSRQVIATIIEQYCRDKGSTLGRD